MQLEGCCLHLKLWGLLCCARSIVEPSPCLAFLAEPFELCLLSGGPLMTKFVSIFRELGSFNELLGTQVELILVEKLQHTWLKVGDPANCNLMER